ncbi:MAG: MFS transporter [Halobacteriota archaeon]|nr:MFS transporter [Halobacteriota archaeon]
MVILSFTLVVVMLGYGMVIPILPFYVDAMDASGRDLGLLIAIFSLMQFIFAPMWGSYSDKVGRKPVLMLGLLGDGIAMFLFAISTQMWMLILSRAFTGILSAATFPTAMAYVSDSTSDDERGGGMGIMGASMGLGVIMGPGFGGLLAADSLSAPFFIASALSFVALPLILFLLPESLSKELRSRSREEEKLGIKMNFVLLKRSLFGPIGVLLFMAFLLSFGLTNFEGIFGLYALEKYDYGPEQVGSIMMVIAIVATVAQGTLAGPLTKRFGEAMVIKTSLLLSSIAFLFLLQAKTYPTVLLTTGFFILSKTLLRPAVLSLTSKHATTGQGVTMGLSNSFMSLGRIAGPIWAGIFFDINFDYPYLSGAVIMFIGFLISLLFIPKSNE